ncbi:CgeB family protein [Spirosoma pomorum]
MNQKFLLIAPWDYQLYKVIEKNLKHLEYDVTVVHNNYYRFTLKDLSIKIKYLLRKIFPEGKMSNQKAQNLYKEQKRLSLVKSQQYYDICLVLRADVFSEYLLKEAKRRSHKFISFFYDGLTYNQHVLPLVPLFDYFYIFDKTELGAFGQYGVSYAPNFYFTYPSLGTNPKAIQNKIYYISSFNPFRLDFIQSLHQYLSHRISMIRFDLVCSEAEQEQLPDYVKQNFNCIRSIVPYEEQLKLIQNSEIIIDVKMVHHSGFSFRIFDGLKLRKKVITTNSSVVNEDFYHPNNFFILTKDNEKEIDEFLQRPYIYIDNEIIEKYSFESWLKVVTNY